MIKFLFNHLLLILLLCTIAFQANAGTGGTSDGTYDFGNLSTVTDSGGSGFRLQGDKFKVSNSFLQSSPPMELRLIFIPIMAQRMIFLAELEIS